MFDVMLESMRQIPIAVVVKGFGLSLDAFAVRETVQMIVEWYSE